jgi:predicted PurR-regulated permease PerM
VPALWADSRGRVGIRSAQILLILAVAVVSVYALMQIKLLVIPVLIALILAAAIGPFVDMLRRCGPPGGAATGIAFVALLVLLAGASTVIYSSVRPIPVDSKQLDQAREGIVQFATSSQVRPAPSPGCPW